jgi:aminoglycoside 2''-phosphotransferase
MQQISTEIAEKIARIEKLMRKSCVSWKVHDNGLDHLILEINNEWMFRFVRLKKSIRGTSTLKDFFGQFSLVSPCQIPRIDFISEDFIGYRKIEGQMLNDQVLQKMHSIEQEKFVAQIADFLTALHNFPRRLDGIHKGDRPDKKGLCEKLCQKVYPRLSSSAQKSIHEYLEDAFADKDIMGGESTLVHGDLRRNNIIMKNNELVGIIDFDEL